MGDCFGRTPFGSLIAMMICGIGVGLFCATLYLALEITLERIFEDLFYFRVPWLENLQIAFVIVGVVMGLLSMILFVFGILSTGATRKNVYSGVKCIMGGRVSALAFLSLAFVLNMIWCIMCGICAAAIVVFMMVVSVCINEIEGQPEYYLDNFCFNLSRFGIYKNYTEGVDKNALCGNEELEQLCQHVRDAEPLYGLAFAGSLLIVISLVLFIISLTTNYNQIKTTKELTEYREAAEFEMAEGYNLDTSRGPATLAPPSYNFSKA